MFFEPAMQLNSLGAKHVLRDLTRERIGVVGVSFYFDIGAASYSDAQPIGLLFGGGFRVTESTPL